MLQAEPVRIGAQPAESRDYIATMAGELATMARLSGDRRLALLLDLAASFAEMGESTRS